MGKKLKLILFVLLPTICLIIAGIPFTLADYPETQTEQTMNGISAENTGASTADKSFKGGALYISNGASYTMTGGSIAGKTNQYGGAVYVTNGSTFTMTGGTITGCSALYGGAIYVEAGGTCNITGGTITGNKAQFAPAIYVEDGGILNVDQTAVIKDNEYEKYGNLLEVYVDGSLVQTRYIKADTYIIDENEMPLDYEHCCGYFLDEKLSQCSNGEISLTASAKGFASRTADAEEYVARLYTRTANPDNFTFTYKSSAQTYDIKAKNTSISGHIVLPKEYNNVQTSIAEGTSAATSAFSNCTSITGVTFQEGLTSVGSFAFINRSSLTGELIIPDSVTSIGEKSFDKCGFTGDLIIPDSVTNMDYFAFGDCSGFTGNLSIGSGVTNISILTFYNVYNLTGITISSLNTVYEDKGKNVIIEKSTNTLILGCNSTNLSVLEEVANIGQSAFERREGLIGDLIIGSSVTSIGQSAFGYCRGLTGSLVIPDSVTTIGDSAFSFCSGLTGSLTIPDSVTSLGNYVFRDCSGFTGSLTIGNSVKSIKYMAFDSCSGLTGNLIIPDSVTSIGNNAFDSCSGLTGNLIIPDSVTSIGKSAFFNCSGLTGSLIIPDSVTSIGNQAFSNCKGLTSIYIPSRVTTISSSAYNNSSFYGCSSSLVIYTDVSNAESIPSGWGTYWNYYDKSNQLQVVYGCSLDADGNIIEPVSINIYVNGASTPTKVLTPTGTSYTVVESDMPLDYESCCGYFYDEILMTTIKNNTIDLTKGDVNLYTRTATDSSYFTFEMNEITGNYDIVDTSLMEVDVVLPKEYQGIQVGLGITDERYEPNTNKPVFTERDILSITLPSGITEIIDYAFYYCSSIKVGLIIPDSVISIGNSAFAGCDGLTSLTIGSGVTSIGNNAFEECIGLTGALIIPDAVTEIGESAFVGCEGLTSVTIPNSVTSIGDSAFYYCSGLTSVTIPNSVTSIGDGAFYNCSGLTGSLIIPESVTSIGERAFYCCSGLTSVTIGNSVTSIGDGAFYNCSGLTGNLIIPESVTSIGNSAFAGCSGLTGSLIIPESVTSIGNSVFSSCSGLNGNLIIPDSVTSIGENAFDYCSGLTSVIIGNSVTSIGAYAFYYCSGLTSVYIPSSVTTISASSYSNSPFYNCSSSLVIYTDVAKASSKPSDWDTYWNYYGYGKTLTVNYGYTLEQYKSAVGLTFAPNNNRRIVNESIEDNEIITQSIRAKSVQEGQSFLPNKKESCVIFKENKIA